MLLCNALVLSRLDYCNSILCASKSSHLAQLQRVINLSARIIMRLRRSDHISPAVMELRWLPTGARVHFKVAVLVFKCLHRCAPDYLSSCLVIHRPRRTLRGSSSPVVSLELGMARTGVGRGAWAVAGPRIWNNLPAAVRDQSLTLIGFQSLLLEHLFC